MLKPNWSTVTPPLCLYVFIWGFLFVCFKTTLNSYSCLAFWWRASWMKQKGEHRPQEKEEERRKNDESSESQSLDLQLRGSYTSTEQHVLAPGSWYKSLFQIAPLSLHMSSPFGIDRKKRTIQARRGKTWCTQHKAAYCSAFRKKSTLMLKVEAMH